MYQEPEISFDGPKWFCVVVEPNCQRQAEYFLGACGYRTFLPKARRWISHARVRKAVERPLLGRYLFVEVDYPRQSFGRVRAAQGVESIISDRGVPCVMPRGQVERLLHRQLSGEFDSVAGGAIPIGARVRIVKGEWDNLLATVTACGGHGRRLSVKLLGQNITLDRLSADSVRPATGFDLRRVNDAELRA